MIYIANGAPSADRYAEHLVSCAQGPYIVNLFLIDRFRGTMEEANNAILKWKENDEKARLAVVEALGLKLYWLIEHNVPSYGGLFAGGDERYYQAICNALADIVRDTKIIYQWRQYKIDWYQYKLSWPEIRTSDFFRWRVDRDEARLNWEREMLRNAHPATSEALAWHKAASALQKLVDSRKKKEPTVRDYPEIDLPEFELAPSWTYLPAAT